MIEIKKDYMAALLKHISDTLQIPVHAIKSKSRKPDLVLARHIFCYLAKHSSDYNLTLHEIGNFIGRDHSLVCHAEHRINNDIDVKYKPTLSALNKVQYQKVSSYLLTYKPINLVNLIKNNQRLEKLSVYREEIIN